jgi:hypothetical protein
MMWLDFAAILCCDKSWRRVGVARAAHRFQPHDPAARLPGNGSLRAQFIAPKGTLPHRTVGWIWVVLMVAVSASSFWIHELRTWGEWSAIHLLSIFTLATLPLAVLHARRHRVASHRNAMIAIFTGAFDHRRRLYVRAGPDHARRSVRQLAPWADKRSPRGPL